ncbi:hypothetical protein LX32DRAFT_635752 [Colletotrichum zoysiae]|uniref:Uncharacterized protein n=1 Tax=Colletotrichum zoysiae TaxID=1216348 RepID=A0AAD9M8N7_9PEZI|nr:hypothetical protein LX32DRAFT_635752 [Colletotrichum zoysiae]
MPSHRIANTGYSISSHPSIHPSIHPLPSPNAPLLPVTPSPAPLSSPVSACACLIARSVVPFDPSYPISLPTSPGTNRQLEVL